MQIGSIVDVALVMSALYVGLSCICSFCNEQIAALFRLRGTKLHTGILRLIGDATPLVQAIYAHPLIASDANDARPHFGSNRPSYIDARNFSMAFWQSLLTGAAAAPPAAGAAPPAGAAGAAPMLVTEPAAALAALRGSVQALPNAALRTSVASLLTTAGDDYNALLSATDAWYDAQMDRVSGWYRRQTQYVLIVIAAVVVIGTGLDSIELSRQLYAAPVVLSSIAGSIQSAFVNGQADPSKLEGAYASVLATTDLHRFLHPFFADFGHHVAGMLATLIALSLGAPFWFDALSRLVNVRMAGSKPAAKRAG